MRISRTTIVVPDYDIAIDYYVNTLGFHLIEDTKVNEARRWVVVAPSADPGHGLLIAQATSDEQKRCIGNQTGGRVAFFLETNDFHTAHAEFRQRGVKFTESPRTEPYDTVAVFEDLFGNRWDLIEPYRSDA